jgi:hypothetical protein
LGTTDENGRLSVQSKTAPQRDCDVAVEQVGFKPVTYKVSQVCNDHGTGDCTSMDLSAIMQRSTGSAGDVK